MYCLYVLNNSVLMSDFSCIITGEVKLVNEEEDEDEYLSLLYDPCLNCYFDPKTGKYYELAWLKTQENPH